MATIIQRPNTPEERVAEESEWLDAASKDRLVASWGVEDALLADDDLQGLIRYRRQRLDDDPDHLHALEDLAQAYLWAEEGAAAVALLAAAHRRHPSRESVQRLLLEALFQQGSNERDFPWVQRIPVLRLGPKVVDLCHQIVTEAEGLMTLGELYDDLTYQGFLVFRWQELSRFLRRLGDFQVRGSQRHPWRLWVELPDVLEDGAESAAEPSPPVKVSTVLVSARFGRR